MEFINPQVSAAIKPTGVTSPESLTFKIPAGYAISYETETVFHASSEIFRATFWRRTAFDRLSGPPVAL